jgi:hypothetical protein
MWGLREHMTSTYNINFMHFVKRIHEKHIHLCLSINTVPNFRQFHNLLISLHLSTSMQHKGLHFKNKSVCQLYRFSYTTINNEQKKWTDLCSNIQFYKLINWSYKLCSNITIQNYYNRALWNKMAISEWIRHVHVAFPYDWGNQGQYDTVPSY